MFGGEIYDWTKLGQLKKTRAVIDISNSHIVTLQNSSLVPSSYGNFYTLRLTQLIVYDYRNSRICQFVDFKILKTRKTVKTFGKTNLNMFKGMQIVQQV